MSATAEARADFAELVGELAGARAERDAAERQRDELLREIRSCRLGETPEELLYALADAIAGHKP